MKYWVARDKGAKGCAWLYEDKPSQDNGYWFSDGNFYNIDIDLFPEVTFENSPQQVEIKLI